MWGFTCFWPFIDWGLHLREIDHQSQGQIRLCFSCFQVPQGPGSLDCKSRSRWRRYGSSFVPDASGHHHSSEWRFVLFLCVQEVLGSDHKPPPLRDCNRAIRVPAGLENSQNIVESSLISMTDFSQMKASINKRSKVCKTSHFSSLDPMLLARMDEFEF